MLPIRGVYEVVVRVRDLSQSERFYCDVLGLTTGLRAAERGMSFLRAGGHAGMVVLQQDAGGWPAQHLAFEIAEADLERSAEHLREHGVEVRGPVLHDWMPARSLYFLDPDGHELELCAPIEAA